MQTHTRSNVTLAGDRWERILPAMQRLVDTGNYPGFSVLVYRRGQVIYDEVTGAMDTDSGRLLQKDTLYRMYSQTKRWPARALLMQFEEGKFPSRDPFRATFLPLARRSLCRHELGGMRLTDPRPTMTIPTCLRTLRVELRL